MEHTHERVISVSLAEAEWQAFIQKHPQPVTWLRERIQESMGSQGTVTSPLSAPAAVNRTSATTR